MHMHKPGARVKKERMQRSSCVETTIGKFDKYSSAEVFGDRPILNFNQTRLIRDIYVSIVPLVTLVILKKISNLLRFSHRRIFEKQNSLAV